MRKALLVIALIAASFAGGAVVNGPGLAWLRNTLGLTTLRIEGDPFRTGGERVDEPDEDRLSHPEPRTRRTPSLPRSSTTHDEELTSPLVVDESASINQTPSAPRARTKQEPRTSTNDPPPLEPPRTRQAHNPMASQASTPATHAQAQADGWGDAPGSAPPQAFLHEPSKPEPINDRDHTPQQPPSLPPSTRDHNPDRTTSQSTASHPPRPEAPPSSGDALSTANTDRWSQMIQRMETLGVKRYWIEGVPGGTVLFRCTVPTETTSTVSQQFEAEGDDIVNAAESALRRITLWRATENP